MIRLQIEQLTKSIGDRILFSDLSLTVEEGDKIGIVARNGSGKTTLLNIICGLDDYDSGKITFSDGIRVGYLSQSPAFDPEETALGYATPEPHDSEDYGAEDRAKQMLGQLGISDFGQKLGSSIPCCRRSAIHSASFTSVLRPGTAFIWRAFTTIAFSSQDSRMLYRGFQ